jgi:hypothetical protein
MEAYISLPHIADYLNSMAEGKNLSNYYGSLQVDHHVYPVTYFAKDL